MTHIEPQQLWEYIDGELNAEATKALQDHLENCDQCMKALTQLDTFNLLAQQTFPKRTFTRPTPASKWRQFRWPIAAAAALLLITGGFGYAALRGMISDDNTQIEQTTEETAPEPTKTIQVAEVQEPARSPTPTQPSPKEAEPTSEPTTTIEIPTITGHVTDIWNNPLRDASIRAVVHSAPQLGRERFYIDLATTRTDTTGAFQLPLTPDVESLLIARDGYQTINYGLRVTPTPPFELQVKLYKRTPVQGRVVDIAGNPIPGVAVLTGDSIEYGHASLSSTDANGRFLVQDRSDWSSGIFFQHHDFADTHVAAINQFADSDIIMVKGGKLRTRVLRNGKPVPKSSVYLTPALDIVAVPRQRHLITDDEGYATFNALPSPMTYNLAAIAPNDEWPPHLRKKVFLQEQGETTINIQITRNYTAMVHGTVRDENQQPVPHAWLNNASGGKPYQADIEGTFSIPIEQKNNWIDLYYDGTRTRREFEHTGSGHTFETSFTVLPKKEYTIPLLNGEAEPISDQPLEIYLANVGGGGILHFLIDTPKGNLSLHTTYQRFRYQVYAPTTAETTAGVLLLEDNEPGDIRLDQDTGRIEGFIKTEQGTPVPWAIVDARSGRGSNYYYRSTQTDAEGFFALEGLPLGLPTSIRAHSRNYQELLETDLTPATDPAPLQLTLNERKTVVGQVVYADGSPASLVTILQRGSQDEFTREADTAGKFIVLPGDDTIEVQALFNNDILSNIQWVTSETTNLKLTLPSKSQIREDNIALDEELLLTRQQTNNDFKQWGIIFKMFANESRGELYVPMPPTEGAFYPEIKQIYPEYLTDPNIAKSLLGVGPAKAVYFGYALDNEQTALTLLDAYEELGPQAIYDSDLIVGDGLGTAGSDTIYRMTEGLRQSMSDTGIEAPSQSKIPILWELPGTREQDGGWVLYADGHTQWVTYPGQFPMTETLIQRILQLRQDPTDLPDYLTKP